MKEQRHIVHIMKKPRSKQLIKVYKLWQSKLIFTRAEYVNNNVFHLFHETSVSSQIMSDRITRSHGKCIKMNCSTP